ncbi:hypothetical protein MMC2321_02875 [Chitinophaga sp. MM2321]
MAHKIEFRLKIFKPTSWKMYLNRYKLYRLALIDLLKQTDGLNYINAKNTMGSNSGKVQIKPLSSTGERQLPDSNTIKKRSNRRKLKH